MLFATHLRETRDYRSRPLFLLACTSAFSLVLHSCRQDGGVSE